MRRFRKGNGMALQVACMNCGEGIEVSDEALEEAQRLSIPLSVTHDVCPKDRKVLPKYRLTILVEKNVEGQHGEDGGELYIPIARTSSTTEAHSFAAALPTIENEVTANWEKVAGLARIADED